MPNLKIPRLHMDEFELIIRSKNPLPAAFAVRLKLFDVRNVASLATARVFDTVVSNFVIDVIHSIRWWLHYWGGRIGIFVVHPFLYQFKPTWRPRRLPRRMSFLQLQLPISWKRAATLLMTMLSITTIQGPIAASAASPDQLQRVVIRPLEHASTG